LHPSFVGTITITSHQQVIRSFLHSWCC